jgi:hypothetical protein
MEEGLVLNYEGNNDNLHKKRVGFELNDGNDVNNLHMHGEKV